MTKLIKNRDLVIVGLGETSDIAYEYFLHDSHYNIVAFSASRAFVESDTHIGLPLVPLDELASRYPAESVDVYVAISYTQLNRIRTALFQEVKSMGYKCANYVSSRAFVWHNVEMGENNFIFENNVLQHKVRLGNNIILWSGNHIGHRTIVEDNVYVSSHCVVSGYCRIGSSSFIGVNATFNDKIAVASDNIVGSGALVVRDSEPGQLLIGAPAKPSSRTAFEVFGIDP
jgi:sugar O-acyltransferase (sialic acid O-acetyltransferase NeuD family)